MWTTVNWGDLGHNFGPPYLREKGRFKRRFKQRPTWRSRKVISEYAKNKNLQDKQDKIVRALFSKFFPRKRKEIYIAMNISNIKVSYKIRVSLYLFDILYTNKFPQLKSSTEALIFNHGYNTRKNTLLIPQNNFSKSKYHFLYNSIKIWNEIPAKLKKCRTQSLKLESWNISCRLINKQNLISSVFFNWLYYGLQICVYFCFYIKYSLLYKLILIYNLYKYTTYTI